MLFCPCALSACLSFLHCQVLAFTGMSTASKSLITIDLLKSRREGKRSLFLASTMDRWSWLATIRSCCFLFYGGLPQSLDATMNHVLGYYFGSLARCSWCCLRSLVLDSIRSRISSVCSPMCCILVCSMKFLFIARLP